MTDLTKVINAFNSSMLTCPIQDVKNLRTFRKTSQNKVRLYCMKVQLKSAETPAIE